MCVEEGRHEIQESKVPTHMNVSVGRDSKAAQMRICLEPKISQDQLQT